MYGCNTDSIFVKAGQEELSKIFTFKDEIGCYKFETGKYIRSAEDKCKMIKQKINTEPKLNDHRVNDIKINDEFDQEEIKGIYDKYDRVMAQGLVAGVGKTASIKNCVENVLFVAPFNRLVQDLQQSEVKAVTLHQLLNLSVEGTINKHCTGFDVSDFDTICFDELYLYTPDFYARIDKFMRRHTDKKFVATGDIRQLKSFGFAANNIPDMTAYKMQCVALMFPNQFTLKINKRCKTDADRKKVLDLSNDILDVKKDVMETFAKYGIKIITDMKDVKTLNNIAYFNFRTREVNKHIQKQVMAKGTVPKGEIVHNGISYYIGLHLICTKYLKTKAVKLNTNFEYKITEIDEDYFVVEDVVNKENRYTLKIDL